MSCLLTQMFLYMLVTFLLGLLLGWLLWRCGQRSSADYEALSAKYDTLGKERYEIQANLDATPSERPVVPAAPVATAFTGTASKPEGLSGPCNGKADDLQLISGVGPKMERLLHGLGYYHFDQIAKWTSAEAAWVDDNLEGFKGRATRDEWTQQARKLA